MRMNVRDLIDRLETFDGSRFVRVVTGHDLGAEITEVKEDDELPGKSKTITIFAEGASVSTTDLMDAWSMNKQPIEVPGYNRRSYTTMQIADELEDMIDVSKADIVSYLYNHGYIIKQFPDGPKWVTYVRVLT